MHLFLLGNFEAHDLTILTVSSGIGQLQQTSKWADRIGTPTQ